MHWATEKSGNFTKITEVAVTFQCTSVPITSYNNSGVSFKPLLNAYSVSEVSHTVSESVNYAVGTFKLFQVVCTVDYT